MDCGAGTSLNTVVKIGQTVYELIAVSEQARDLLDSANHVTSSVEVVRSLRRQKSGHLQAEEKKWIDQVVNDTEKTLVNVAALVEPARVDMQTRFGKIGLLKRALFVFRDSPKVATNLARLTLTSQSLNTALGLLSSREGLRARTIQAWDSANLPPSDCSTTAHIDIKSPPSYEESEYLSRKRMSRAKHTRSLLDLDRNVDLDQPSVAPQIPLHSKPTFTVRNEARIADTDKPVITVEEEHTINVRLLGKANAHYRNTPVYEPYRPPIRDIHQDDGHEYSQDYVLSSITEQIQEWNSPQGRSPTYHQSVPYPSSKDRNSRRGATPEQIPSETLYNGEQDTVCHGAFASDPRLPGRPPYPTFPEDAQPVPLLVYPVQPLFDESSCRLPSQDTRSGVCELSHVLPRCLRLGQVSKEEVHDSVDAQRECTVQRKLTAREMRKHWYESNAAL
jgi:hypothetical protein